MKVGDVVTVWGENGDDGGYLVASGTDPNSSMTFDSNTPSHTFTMTSEGTLTLTFYRRYSGLRKITIQSQERETPHYDYDPGYEEYDMYDEFSENNKKRDGSWHTEYNTNSPDVTGFNLNGQPAKYIVLSSSKITANNRIAIYPYNNWRFNYGLRAPSNNNGTWANFSICNLREGDRVVFSYTGTAPVFSSVGGTNPQSGPYNGANAFFDKYNDGTFDEGEDFYITPGATPLTDWYRGEGNIYAEDNNGTYNDSPDVNPLRYTRYVITEDGHLDLAIAPDTRIVKIKIYSDHQASMVDEYDAEKYTAKFDITGELQAMEHIVPGGLEVHVGSDDASQHAHVVSSPQGPVSIVNGVNGYKLPGMSLDANGNLQFQFNLANNIPETGTFYKFMPLEDGKMTLTFQAASMNYYSYAIDGDAVYYGTNWSYDTSEQGNIWTEQFDRPNEQTRNVECPYYLVKVTVQPNGTLSAPSKVKFTYKIKNSDGVTSQGTIDPNDTDESKRVLKAPNGADVTISPVDEVKDNEIYYLYGGWNTTDLRFNGSGQGRNSLEYLPYGDGNGGENKACGVAKLLEVVFNPNKKIYPLAKWVPNGTIAVYKSETDKSGVPNPDNPSYAEDDLEYELADLYGYLPGTKITVKKMSGNITACHPYLVQANKAGEHNHYKLMIDGITYDGNKDKGGTILIKIGDTKHRENPVYTLTIAYSTDPTYDGNAGTGTRGHIWDYSSSSLHGFDWEPEPGHAPKPNDQGVFTNDLSANSKYAQPADYGHYFTNYLEADISNYSSVNDVLSSNQSSLQPFAGEGSGLLYKEIHAEEMHSGTSDWKFNYNLVNNNQLFDPVFLNKFDLEGDNADLIWETEGTVFKTSANGSVMFNEFTGADIHQSTKDPDRYVGILKGGEFRIPWLRKNDRVIIYMGTGKGAFNDHAVFNIRGAYDAVHNEISESDDYIVGGSQWNYYTYKDENDQDVVNDDRNYRGCYHFFATGDKNNAGKPADMVFKMTGGSMCKIYSIQIYRGDRINTNEVIGETADDKFLLWSRAADLNDPNDNPAKGDSYNWTLKYFGKDQKLADGTNGVKNDFAAKTGCINYDLVTSDETDPKKPKYNTFSYPNDYGQIGTFRARGKDMEKNMKYVADYGEHNVTVAYQQTMNYPYTWDFMDMTGWGNNATRFNNEDAYGSSNSPTYNWPEWFDSETDWNKSYEKSSTDLSLWGKAVGNDQGYVLRLNTQEHPENCPQDNIFESAQTIDNEPYYGNQFWADGRIVPESQGLWFHTPNQKTLNGSMRVYSDGMSLGGVPNWQYNMVIPNVPASAVVYIRIKKAADYLEQKYKFAGSAQASDITLIPVDPTATVPTEWVASIKNNSSEKKHLTLSFVGYTLEKLAVSMDSKSIGKTGFATESRARIIDHDLTEYFTLAPVKAYQASFDDDSKPTKVILSQIRFMPAAPDLKKDNQGNVTDYGLTNNEGLGCILYHDVEANTDEAIGKSVTGGFHLFVPDMHDNETELSNWDGLVCETSTNILRSCVPAATEATDRLAATDGSDTRYILSAQPYQNADEGYQAGDGGKAGLVGFYRIDPIRGALKSGNIAYMQLSSSQIPQSKMSIVFYDEFVEDNGGIATTIDNASTEGSDEGCYYTLSGLRVNNPTAGGIYVKNGKKVVVK